MKFAAITGVLVTLAGALAAGGADDKTDYQKMTQSAAWGWNQEQAGPAYGISQSGGKYDIRIDVSHDDLSNWTFSIQRDGKPICSWRGHPHTVFRIQEDRLYYARFHTSGSGGQVVAVDLTTGKELWASDLKALGPIQHSAYQNLMNLDANLEVVTVWGNETMGRYLEFKDARTGQTVGHRIFESAGGHSKGA